MPKYVAALTAAVAAGQLKVVPAILEPPARAHYDALAERFGATDAELVVLALQTKYPLLTNEKNLVTATESLGGNAFDLVDLIHDLQAAKKLSPKDVKTLIADLEFKGDLHFQPADREHLGIG